MMSRDLKLCFLLICLPAAVLTGLGLVSLRRQARASAAREEAMRNARIENLAAALQDLVNEAGKTAARASLAGWTGGAGVRAPCGAFAWTPRGRLEWTAGAGTNAFPQAVADRLAALSRWNEWTAVGKKRARRGLMPAGAWTVLWGRVDNAAWGVVFDGHPLADDGGDGPDAWLLGAILVVLLACVLLAGAGLMGRAAAKARRDDLRKTSFVSNVSHELKTPLVGIGLWADLLRGGRLRTEAQRAHAYEVVAAENARMLRLVENLLDFSRLEQGRRRYRIEAVDMGALAAGAVELVRGDFAAHGISVRAEGACHACADADAARQILVNLLGNAAKYAAARGPVEVVVSRTKEGTVRVAVADRGPGMSPEARRRAFERFYRADDALTAGTGGLGLGLSISRALARDLGGELAVAARAGGGCVFTLDLIEAEPPPPPDAPGGRPRGPRRG